MSVEAMSHVWSKSRQSSGRLLILLALADYANDEWVAWPSNETLAIKSRLSVRQVQRTLRELTLSGELDHVGVTDKGCNQWRIAREVSREEEGTQEDEPEDETGDANDGVTDCQGDDTDVRATIRQGGDATVMSGVTPTSPRGDAHVTQSVNEPSVNHQENMPRQGAAPALGHPKKRSGQDPDPQPHIALIDAMADELGWKAVDYRRNVRDARALAKELEATPEDVRRVIRWVMQDPDQARFYERAPFSMTTLRKLWPTAMTALAQDGSEVVWRW